MNYEQFYNNLSVDNYLTKLFGKYEQQIKIHLWVIHKPRKVVMLFITSSWTHFPSDSTDAYVSSDNGESLYMNITDIVWIVQLLYYLADEIQIKYRPRYPKGRKRFP